MVDAVEPRVGQLGITIPASSSADVPIATAPGLAATSSALPTLDRAATVLPLLAIAMGLLVVVVAHRRSRAMRNVGVALALAGAGCLAIVWLGGLVATTADASLSPTLVRSTYDALSADLVQQSMLVAAAGGLLVLLGIVAGLLPTRHSSRRQGATDPW